MSKISKKQLFLALKNNDIDFFKKNLKKINIFERNAYSKKYQSFIGELIGQDNVDIFKLFLESGKINYSTIVLNEKDTVLHNITSSHAFKIFEFSLLNHKDNLDFDSSDTLGKKPSDYLVLDKYSFMPERLEKIRAMRDMYNNYINN